MSLLLGGVVADRVSRRAIMVYADAARLVTQGILAALVIAGTAEVWSLALLSGLTGIATGFFNPASTGLLPAIVAPERLQQANGVRATAMSAGEIGGPVLAGVLVAAFGAGWALAVDAATFARQRPAAPRVARPRAHAARGDRPTGATCVRAGRPSAAPRGCGPSWCGRRWPTCSGARGACSGRSWPRTTSADRRHGARSTPRSASARCWAPSARSARCRGARSSRPPSPASSICPRSRCWRPARRRWRWRAGALVFGIGMMFGNTVWESTLQRHIRPEALSRVSAYDWFGSLAFAPVGLAIWGPIADGIGIGDALWLAALLSAASTVLLLAVRDVRELHA